MTKPKINLIVNEEQLSVTIVCNIVSKKEKKGYSGKFECWDDIICSQGDTWEEYKSNMEDAFRTHWSSIPKITFDFSDWRKTKEPKPRKSKAKKI